MKKTITIEQVFRLKAALREAGYRVPENVALVEADRFSFDIFGTVPYSGAAYRERVHVTTGTLPGAITTPAGYDVIAADGELLVGMESICGGMTNYLRRYNKFDAKKIADDIAECNKKLDASAKWNEAWRAARERGITDKGARTRFLRKYCNEHFPGEFYGYLNNRRK